MNKYVLAVVSSIWAVCVLEGNSAMTIVIPETPSVSEEFAAEELKYHLEKATGKTLPVVNEAETPAQGRRFFIGNVKALSRIGIEYSRFNVDERILKGMGGDIYFAGGEAKWIDESMKNKMRHCLTYYGFGGGGTLYAVYDFLERDMGVRWIWPGELGEMIPAVSVPFLDGVERRGAEPLLYRIINGDPEAVFVASKRIMGWKDVDNARKNLRLRRLWLTRNRIGRSVVYRSGHAFEDWYIRFKNHPEYFAMQPSGLRGRFSDLRPCEARNKYYPLCVSNTNVHDIIVSDWERANRDAIKEGRRPLNINCCENDSPGFCVCSGCRAWDAADPRFKTHPYWKGEIKDVKCSNRGVMAKEQWGEDGEAIEGTSPPSVTDRYVRFSNTVLAKARKVYPKAELVAYSYSNYRYPPVETRLSDGILISFVPGIIFPYSKKKSDEFRNDWSAWCRKGATRMFYRPNYMHGGGSMPYSQAARMAEDINFAYASGAMIAISQDSILGAWSAQAMKNYVAVRILREPDATYGKMSEEFYSAFGAAAEDVRRYCDMLGALDSRFEVDEWSKIGRENRSKKGSPGGGWSNFVLNIANLYSEGWFANADDILLSASGKVDGRERERVEFLRKGLHDGLLTYRTRVAQKSGNETAFKAAFDAMVGYRAEVESEGICAWGYFARVEADHAGWPHVALGYGKSADK